MRVHIGGDHAAYEMQRDLVSWLTEQGHEVVDHGPAGYDELDDYPVYVLRAAEAVAADPGSLGVVLGGSGNGEQMAANKVTGIRAALAWSPELATLSRQHNDARVVSVGARMHSLEEGRAIVEAFLTTGFSGEERHQRRIDMMTAYETDGTLPPLP
ncbi:ribose-5-phosphate isomerase [Ornithinimicrobium kibberense]|uniref:Ribose-5-phosphate isomerase B n=1 Tax=Ornithinimicrobium kibberense TaxID=282060 RepID=A0ABV5V3N1_9MICO|nr:ribose-5-phosphate isomerase [Ornithinimicrobium kibberense]